METYDKGRLGEDLAALYLEERGCRVLQRNYRREGCEIDLVAMEEDTLVFAEVKARSSRAWGYGREAVDALTARLAADGWPAVSGPRVTGDGYYESCVAGFEGNLIEITV